MAPGPDASMTFVATPRRFLLASAALLGPLLVLSAYLYVSRAASWDMKFVETGDYIALVVAIVLSATCVGALFATWRSRLLAALICVPLMGFASVVYTLWFVCGVFGDCL